MTTQARNEAAERLRAMAPIDPYAPAWQAEMDRLLDEALAAERRATMKALIQKLHGGDLPGSTEQEKAGIQYAALWIAQQLAILDEEAAR